MLFRSDRKSTRLNSSHTIISYAVFCLKKKKKQSFTALLTFSDFVHLMYTSLGDIVKMGALEERKRSIQTLRTKKRICSFFFFNDPAPPEIYPLSLHDALPIWPGGTIGLLSWTPAGFIGQMLKTIGPMKP